MRQPVTTVIRRQPLGPKPSWQDLFLEPAYPAETRLPDEDDDMLDDDQELTGAM